MDGESWRDVANAQSGLVTRAQLNQCGVDRWAVRHRVDAGRWLALTPTVVATTTGALTRGQLMWLGVLHGGSDALVGDLTAAEVAGLRNWHRDHVTVLVPHGADVGQGHPGIEFRWVRRPLGELRRPGPGLPVCRIEPAVLMFASRQRSHRTAEGVLAGGVQSVSEMDVVRMCRRFGLARPDRQVPRRDPSGRRRFTDCEWPLPDGRVLVLEVDGAFHMDVGHWEDDLARQRGLTAPHRIVVRCTARELRDTPERVARDLESLGVGLAG